MKSRGRNLGSIVKCFMLYITTELHQLYLTVILVYNIKYCDTVATVTTISQFMTVFEILKRNKKK